MLGIHTHHKPNPRWKFACLIVVMGLIFLADALIAYVTPVYVEAMLHSTILLGFIFAVSSVSGILADITLPVIFSHRHHYFFLYAAATLGIGFLLLILFAPPTILILFAAMNVWGLYYECMRFGNYHAVHAFVPKQHYVLAWSMLGITEAAAYTIGPLIASNLIEVSLTEAFVAALICMSLAALLLALLSFSNHNRPATDGVHPLHKHHPFVTTARVWKTLNGHLWPLLLFVVCLGIVDATFWTTGALLSESLADQGHGLLLTAYTAPLLFVGLVATRITPILGKKRTSLVAGALGGLFLLIAGITPAPWMIIASVLCAGVLLALAWPAINATFEDYFDRLPEELENDLIGLRNAATSLAFIIGPILAGIVTSAVGAQRTFSVVGILLFGAAAIGILVLPRKIRLPQTELQQELD